MKICLKNSMRSLYCLFIVLWAQNVFAMHFAPKGSILLDSIMYDYIIPILILGLFGFIFVVLAIIGRDTWDAWRNFCILYFSLFLFLIINFSCWWLLKKCDVPKRELTTIIVSVVTAVFLIIGAVLHHLFRNQSDKAEPKTWTCPHCGKINTFTLSCWNCSEPRVLSDSQENKESRR